MFFHLMLKELEFWKNSWVFTYRHGISTLDVTNDISAGKWNMPSSALVHVSQLARSSRVCSVSLPSHQNGRTMHELPPRNLPALENFVARTASWKCVTE